MFLTTRKVVPLPLQGLEGRCLIGLRVVSRLIGIIAVLTTVTWRYWKKRRVGQVWLDPSEYRG